MSAKDPFSILYKESTSSKQTSMLEKSKKVERYRPGKAPAWPEESESGRLSPSESKNDLPTPTMAISSININQIQTLKPSASPPPSPHANPTANPLHSSEQSQLKLYPDEDYQVKSENQVRSKPQFVSKTKRVTHVEREIREQEQEEVVKQLKELQEEKKVRTTVIVAEAILRE